MIINRASVSAEFSRQAWSVETVFTVTLVVPRISKGVKNEEVQHEKWRTEWSKENAEKENRKTKGLSESRVGGSVVYRLSKLLRSNTMFIKLLSRGQEVEWPLQLEANGNSKGDTFCQTVGGEQQRSTESDLPRSGRKAVKGVGSSWRAVIWGNGDKGWFTKILKCSVTVGPLKHDWVEANVYDWKRCVLRVTEETGRKLQHVTLWNGHK